jgi:chromate transporter
MAFRPGCRRLDVSEVPKNKAEIARRDLTPRAHARLLGERDVKEASGLAFRRMLLEIALLFLRLGATAFGGPAAHIALMQEEVVRRRRWVSSEEFLDLLGATQLIPGPNSTELAIHLGHRRGGAAGLVVAGVCFILPAALITLFLAWAYVRFGRLPNAVGALYGIKPVIIAVVLQAIGALARTAVKSTRLAIIGAGAAAAAALRANELLILLVAGVSAMSLARPGRGGAPARRSAEGEGSSLFVVTGGTAFSLAAGSIATPAPLGSIFLAFAKIGSVLFGSGYVLLAFLRSDLVEDRHWLTEAQLIDAIAAGQLTPGPVFTTATFVGYVIAGTAGAAAATAGIFVPAFIFVALSAPLIPTIRASRSAGSFLDGVNVASLALMAVVAFELGRAAIIDVPTAALAAASAFLLLVLRVNSAWLVLGGGVAGAGIRAALG